MKHDAVRANGLVLGGEGVALFVLGGGGGGGGGGWAG